MPDAQRSEPPAGQARLPQAEPEAPQAPPDAAGIRRTPAGSGRDSALDDEGRAGRGINQAGFIKDREDPTAQGPGDRRDSGER